VKFCRIRSNARFLLFRFIFLLTAIFLTSSLFITPFQAMRAGAHTQSNNIPAPEATLGFKVGEDRKLAKWDQFLAYFGELAKASDRIKFETLGKTTLGRPFVVATISSPENLKRLSEFREIQRKLADPRLLANESESVIGELIRAGRSVVVITCGIHSTEVGGTFTATELAHKLTSQNTPEVKQILDNVILLLVPSLNPDGVDIVTDWYRKTLGTPAEGSAPPELYHHYTGHDNNRENSQHLATADSARHSPDGRRRRATFRSALPGAVGAEHRSGDHRGRQRARELHGLGSDFAGKTRRGLQRDL
jgi:hypothetical protein